MCEVFSIPGTELVEWAHNGRVISPSASSDKYSVSEKRTPGGTRSTLAVADVDEDDLGAYICTAANAFGTDSAVIHLRKKGESSSRLEIKRLEVPLKLLCAPLVQSM